MNTPDLTNWKKALIWSLGLFGSLIIAYIIVSPWWLKFDYLLSQDKRPDNQQIELIKEKVQTIKQEIVKPVKANKAPLAPHRLVITKINVNAPIVEGQDDRSLDYGVWRLPGSAKPEQIGNMVLTGHRFKYLPPNNTTFYHLDKLVSGDKLAVIWDKNTYYYQVIETKIVTPEQNEILNQTNEKQLTIYTCHPLWSQKERLVIIAKAIQ